MSNLIPPRFRREAVARYWPHIQAVITSWPTPIKVNPSPLAVETFVCRFRDAVTAIMIHGMGTNDQYHQLKDIAELIMVKPVSDGILIGNRHRIKAIFKSPESSQAGTVIDAKVTLSDSITSPSTQALVAIFVLLEQNIIQHVSIDGVDEAVLQQYISKCTRPLELIQSTKTAFTIF